MSTSLINGFHPRYATNDGDVILVASDGVKFRIHSLMLREASIVFEGMFRMLAPAEQSVETMIPVEEQGFAIAFLLDAIYPQDNLPLVSNFEEALAIATAADKYIVERASAILRLVIMNNEEVRSQTLRLYALACKYRWTDIIASTSRDSLNKPLPNYMLDPERFKQFLEIPEADARNLWRLHEKRKEEILYIGTSAISKFHMDVTIYDEELVDGAKAIIRWECPNSPSHLCDEERISSALEAFRVKLGMVLDKDPSASALFDRNTFSNELNELERFSGFKWIRCGSCKEPFVNEARAWEHFQKIEGRLPKTVFEEVQEEELFGF